MYLYVPQHTPKVCKQICLCLLGLFSESPAVVGGRWFTHTHTHSRPTAHWRPLALFGYLLLTSDTSLSNERPRRLTNHYTRHTLHWWLNIPSAPVPSITNTWCKSFVRLYRWLIIQQTQNYSHITRVQHFYFVIFTVGSAQNKQRTNITKCYFRSNISYTFITKLYEHKGLRK